jgi:hypothetical protein
MVVFLHIVGVQCYTRLRGVNPIPHNMDLSENFTLTTGH